MSIVGVLAVLFGLFGWRFAAVNHTSVRLYVFLGAYVVHIASSVIFYTYALDEVTDSGDYYRNEYGFADKGFGLTTQFIYFLVRTGRETFGGTFLDYFLLFQVVGFFGLCILMRIFEEIYHELRAPQPFYVYLLFFLPGIHFWTSSIGKDGFLFFGVCLALWSAMSIRRRYLGMAFALTVMLMIRPHIALICAAAMSSALIFDRTIGLRIRVLLFVAAVAGLAIAATTVQSQFNVDVTSADSVSDFLSGFEEITTGNIDAGSTAVYGSYPVRLFSLLFRPLFFDATGIMGYIASTENLVLFFIMTTIMWHFAASVRLIRSVIFIRFALVLAVGIVIFLALIYYNVGLGLRQKTMFVPSILVIFVTLQALRKSVHSTHPERQTFAPTASGPDAMART